MAEVMLQMIAVVFQYVIVLVLDFPARSPGRDQLGDVALGDAMMGGEGIVVDLLTVAAGGGELAPVDVQRIVTGAQRRAKAKS